MWEQRLTVALAGVQVDAVRLSQAEAGKQADSDLGAKEALWQKLQEANQRLAAASQARPCTPRSCNMRCLLSWHLHTAPSVNLGQVVQMPHQRLHKIHCELAHFEGRILS